MFLSFKQRNAFQFYLRYLCIYVCIFLFVLFLLLNLYKQAQLSATNTLTNRYVHHIESTMSELEQTMERCQNTVYILTKNRAISQLAIAKSEDYKSYVIQMNEAKELFHQMHLLLGRDVVCSFVIYPNNEYVISNYFVSNDFNKEYPNLLRVNNWSPAEWHAAMLEPLTTYQILPVMHMNSVYSSSTKEVLPFIIPLNINGNYRTANLVFYLDAQSISQSLLDRQMQEEGFLFALTSNNGDFLMGFPLDTPGEKDILYLNDSSYRILSTQSSERMGLHLHFAIPTQVFAQEISNINRIIKIYILIGIVGMLGLSTLYALHNIRNWSRLFKASGIPLPNASPYRYVYDVIDELSRLRDTLSQKLLLLENTYTNNLLTNVCVHGICSKKDYESVSKLLPAENFCIAILRIDEAYQATPELMEAGNRLAQKLNGLVLHHCIDESVFILPMHKDIVDHLSNMTKYGTVGVSEPCLDFHTIHQCYQHAYYAYRDCSNPNSLCFYDSKQTAVPFLWDLEQLSVLQNWILSGKEESVISFFSQLREKADTIIGTNRLQHFFALRQLLRRISEEIEEIPPSMESLLQPRVDESTQDGFQRLEEYTLFLMQHIQEKRSIHDDTTINAIITIIETEFSNPNLSADFLAQRLNFSTKHIYHIVKEQTQKTVGDWIEETRLQFATELLMQTDKKNEEISLLCGFGTINTFYRVFRKKFGITPGEWRKSKSEQTD